MHAGGVHGRWAALHCTRAHAYPHAGVPARLTAPPCRMLHALVQHRQASASGACACVTPHMDGWWMDTEWAAAPT